MPPPPNPAAGHPSRGGETALPLTLLLLFLPAACIPTLLALHQPPSATLLNQCLAVALWGLVAAVLAPRLLVTRNTAPLLTALALVATAALGSWAWGTLPPSLMLQAVGLLAAAALMVVAGASAARAQQGVLVFTALAWALLAAGLLSSAVALVQVFAPDWAGGNWIAASGVPGRAVGNLRQPNHLCSLLVWALGAAVALHQLRRLPGAALALLLPLLVLAVELSASRTGAVGLLLLGLWGLADRQLRRPARLALLCIPLLYLAAWGAVAWWGDVSQQALGASARIAADGGLGETGSPNARSNIWRNALLLIAAQPWLGTGFGEFNLAWSMTPFVNRPTAFFDHSHNLMLQLMVELGLPLALAVLGLLGLALWQAVHRAWHARGEQATVARAALVLVLLTGLHSLVEYPLWYAYFLLPAALAWGLVLGLHVPRKARPALAVAGNAHAAAQAGPSIAGLLAGLLMAAGGTLAVLDYQRVVVIYAPKDNSGTLAERIARGQLSPLFAHHADYAAATNPVPPASRALGLARTIHALLDTRLMMAWASQLHATGHVDEARWVAQRLRDFRNPDAEAFFAPCATGDAQAFQCQAPLAMHDWRALASLPPLLLASDPAADQPAAAAPGASATQ